MTRLFIVGAGNLGREVFSWARDCEAKGSDWFVGGFLDNRPEILKPFNYPVENFGDPMQFSFAASDRVICTIGDPKTKLDYCRRLRGRGAVFTNVVHPTVAMGHDYQIGTGCVVGPFSSISANTCIGDFVTINTHCSIGHDAVVQEGCTLSAHVDVTGWSVLEEGVFVGSHGSVLPKVRIGAWAVVGAGSVAMADVPPNTTVIGVPARRGF